MKLAEDWVSYGFDLRGVAGDIFGPFEDGCDALFLSSGQSNGLWIISEYRRPQAFISVPPTASLHELWDLGFNLNVLGLFLPARFERWWLLVLSPASRLTKLHLLRRKHVPRTA